MTGACSVCGVVMTLVAASQIPSHLAADMGFCTGSMKPPKKEEKATCPVCKKNIAVSKMGTLNLHVIGAGGEKCPGSLVNLSEKPNPHAPSLEKVRQYLDEHEEKGQPDGLVAALSCLNWKESLEAQIWLDQVVSEQNATVAVHRLKWILKAVRDCST